MKHLFGFLLSALVATAASGYAFNGWYTTIDGRLQAHDRERRLQLHIYDCTYTSSSISGFNEKRPSTGPSTSTRAVRIRRATSSRATRASTTSAADQGRRATGADGGTGRTVAADAAHESSAGDAADGGVGGGGRGLGGGCFWARRPIGVVLGALYVALALAYAAIFARGLLICSHEI